MIPIDFQVTCSKVKVKLLFSAHCVVRSIAFDPFTWSVLYLMQGLPSMCKWSLLIFRSHVQRSNHKVNIFWPLHLINTKLGAGVAPNKYMIPIFRSHVQRSRLNYSFEPSVLFNPLVTCFVQVLLLQRR